MRALMYHQLGEGRYALSPENFKKHCEEIAARQQEVHISFDDGHESIVEAASILDSFKLKATFFVITSKIDQPGFVSVNDLKKMADAGHVIASHGHSHEFFTALKPAELVKEVGQSFSCLKKLFGEGVNQLSFPGGRFNSEVLKILASTGQITGLWSSEPGHMSFDEVLPRQGRDCILQGMDTDYLKALLDGKKDASRQRRYRLLSFTKTVLGDRLYHKLTGADEK